MDSFRIRRSAIPLVNVSCPLFSCCQIVVGEPWRLALKTAGRRRIQRRDLHPSSARDRNEGRMRKSAHETSTLYVLISNKDAVFVPPRNVTLSKEPWTAFLVRNGSISSKGIFERAHEKKSGRRNIRQNLRIHADDTIPLARVRRVAFLRFDPDGSHLVHTSIHLVSRKTRS